MPHTPFGTFLAGVSATGSKDPAGSTGIRPTYVFLCQFNSCSISLRDFVHSGYCDPKRRRVSSVVRRRHKSCPHPKFENRRRY